MKGNPLQGCFLVKIHFSRRRIYDFNLRPERKIFMVLGVKQVYSGLQLHQVFKKNFPTQRTILS